MNRLSKDLKKQTLVAPEVSAFQEEGAPIAKAMGQACTCGCQGSEGVTLAGVEVVRAEVGREGKERGGQGRGWEGRWRRGGGKEGREGCRCKGDEKG